MNDELNAATKFQNKIQPIDKYMTLEQMLYIDRLNQKARMAAARACGGPSMKLVFTPAQAQQAMCGLPISDEPTINPATSVPTTAQAVVVPPTVADATPDYTIEDMITKFRIAKEKNSKKHIKVVQQRLYEMVQMAGLKPEDDFAKITTDDAVVKIIAGVKAKNVNNDTKNTTFERFKRLVDFAIELCGDKYNKRALRQIPVLPKVSKSQKHGYQPFTTEELKLIFSPDCDFFDKHPDMFWGCCIGLFTGSRLTAAFTLMAHDIKSIDSIPCIEFKKDHPFKQLKTEDTERIIPIHPQMLELGFLDEVEKRKKRLSEGDDDFLFPICKTKTGVQNDHIGRTFNRLLNMVDLKKRDKNGLCNKKTGKSFHSFRDTASKQMQNAKLSNATINAIIGWAGKGTMEKHYSKTTLPELLDAMKMYNYYEIMSLLRYWADRLRDK